MTKPLRIIYMGTPDFAVPSLQRLIDNNFNVVAVITAPDKPAGRGLKIQETPVKRCATTNNIPVLQPTNLKDPDFIETLRSYNANLQIVVAFRMLPEAVWNMPEIGTFNLHASLLPNYRGAAPINWAIINGEKITGCTTFFLKHEIDTGDILFQEETEILPEDNAGTLHDKLMLKGAELVLKTVEAIAHENYTLQAQKTTIDTKIAPKLYKDTCELDFSQDAITLHNKVRGLSPYPAAWTKLQGKLCKIYATEIVDTEISFDTEYYTDGKTCLYFRTATTALSVLELQLEGKKRMRIDEFLRGAKL